MKIAVIQSLRKADYGGASLKFAIFANFVPIYTGKTKRVPEYEKNMVILWSNHRKKVEY